MQCLLPPHAPLSFESVSEFEVHYTQEHTNRCAACQVNLPSPWLLDLHLSEQHDPLQARAREQGDKTYRCFVQGCDKITLTPQKRRLHLIDKHGFPRNYEFRIVELGIDGRTSLLREARTANTRRRRISDVGTPSWQSAARGKLHANSRAGHIPDTANNAIKQTPSRGKRAAEDDITLNTNDPLRVTDDSDISKGHSESSKTAATAATDVSRIDDVETIAALTNRMEALRFVPLSVRRRNERANHGS